MRHLKISLLILLSNLQSFGQSFDTPVSPGFGPFFFKNLSFTGSGNEKSITIDADSVYVNEMAISLDNIIMSATKIGSNHTLSYDFDASHKFKVTKIGSQIYLKYNDTETTLSDDLISDTLTATGELAFATMIIILDELIENWDSTNVNYDPELMEPPTTCQPFLFRIGASRSLAAGRSEIGRSNYLRSHTDCSAMGTCDTSCAADNHLCGATAHFICNGPTCGGSSDRPVPTPIFGFTPYLM